MFNIGIAAALLSLTAGSISSIASKRLSTRLNTGLAALSTVGIGTAPMAVGMLLYGIGVMPLTDALISAVSGLFLSLGFILRYTSLRTEQLTNSAAVGEAQQAMVVFFGIFVLKENVDVIGMLSILSIFIGSFFVITTKGLKINRRLVPALFASMSWAVYWIMITVSVNGSGNFLLSLFIARVIGVTALMAFLSARGIGGQVWNSGRAKLQRGAIAAFAAVMLVTGLANGVCDALFGVVVAYRIVAIGSALSVLMPVIVAAFAYVLYRERLRMVETLGFAIMIAGAIALSLL